MFSTEERIIQFQSVDKLSAQKSISIEKCSCFNKKPAFRICINKDCTHPSICCKQIDCQCNIMHLDCPQVNLQSLLNKISAKNINSTEILNKASMLFDNLIDRISQISQDTQKIIKRYGLTAQQINFLQYFEQNTQSQLTGKIAYNASKIAGIKYERDFEQIQKCVDKLWSEMDGIFWGIIYSTKDLYEIPIKKSKINSWSGERFLTGIINQMKISMAAVQSHKFIIERLKNSEEFQQQIEYEKQLKKRLIQRNSEKQVIGLRDQLFGLNISQTKPTTQPINPFESQSIFYRNQDQLLKQKKPSQRLLMYGHRQKSNVQNSSFYDMFMRPKPSLKQQAFKQACQNLSEVCNINKQQAEKFVRQNGYDLQGTQKSAEIIINQWCMKNI